ncbi:hypothetical protein L6164_021881 [Bauhinia variegata]|uniref:Uncharacterized protein n=1 Tax=Bauhinia variegata TaxID=167791 RepID=A0ACB9MDS5_BAUVA|nr:hypothetical protein L6164_021881 [Bauhinia variegata]
MYLISFNSFLRRVPLMLYGATWTVLLIVTAGIAALAPVIAFTMAISPSSSFLRPCIADASNGDGDGSAFIRIPLDFPKQMACLPEHAVTATSDLDFFLPTFFAALFVGTSAFLLRSVAVWE